MEDYKQSLRVNRISIIGCYALTIPLLFGNVLVTESLELRATMLLVGLVAGVASIFCNWQVQDLREHENLDKVFRKDVHAMRVSKDASIEQETQRLETIEKLESLFKKGG